MSIFDVKKIVNKINTHLKYTSIQISGSDNLTKYAGDSIIIHYNHSLSEVTSKKVIAMLDTKVHPSSSWNYSSSMDELLLSTYKSLDLTTGALPPCDIKVTINWAPGRIK